MTFEPGARTAKHSHPLGQTLIVTDGVGWTQVDGDAVQECAAGDILLRPRDRRHWHGATPDSSMTHVAIQEALDGINVTWMDQVTDDEYLAARSATKHASVVVGLGRARPVAPVSAELRLDRPATAGGCVPTWSTRSSHDLRAGAAVFWRPAPP